MKSVKILVTGGTIDKVHDTFSEGLDFPKDGTSQIPKVLLESRCDFADVQLLMMKDSLYFDDVDRDAIVAAVEAAAEDAAATADPTGMATGSTDGAVLLTSVLDGGGGGGGR